MRKGTNGKIEGKKNVAKVKALLDSIIKIPMWRGKPNMTEIARLAKLTDRQPLNNNDECKELVAEALRTKGQTSVSRQDEDKVRLERRVRSLEIRADKEMAENFELKRKLNKLQHIERIIEGGGRIIP